MIPVRWLNLHPEVCNPRGHWDTSWLQAVFSERIGFRADDQFVVWRDEWFVGDWPAVVVMIAGNFHAADAPALNTALARHPGVVLILHSDEEAVFPVEHLEHPNMRLWVQTPRPDRAYPEGTRFFGEGWSPYTPEILSAWASPPRTIQVGFRGQVTHDRRKSMYGSFSDAGVWPDINATAGFTMGIARAGYLRELATTKVALCPSGPCTPDTFRVWEALEAGCVPLVDGFTPDGQSGYWRLMLGEEPPFPLVTTWSEGPEMARLILEDFDAHQHTCQTWWRSYQQRLVDQLRADVMAVRA